MSQHEVFFKLRLYAIREPFSLFHHSVLILFEYFSMMIDCNSKRASMRAEHFCTSTTAGSRAKIL